MGHFLNSLELISIAFDANPEWDIYRKAAEATKNNITKHLNRYKDKWFNYLMEFKDNQNLQTLMQLADNKVYRNEMAKMELESNKVKRFYLLACSG